MSSPQGQATQIIPCKCSSDWRLSRNEQERCLKLWGRECESWTERNDGLAIENNSNLKSGHLLRNDEMDAERNQHLRTALSFLQTGYCVIPYTSVTLENDVQYGCACNETPWCNWYHTLLGVTGMETSHIASHLALQPCCASFFEMEKLWNVIWKTTRGKIRVDCFDFLSCD